MGTEEVIDLVLDAFDSGLQEGIALGIEHGKALREGEVMMLTMMNGTSTKKIKELEKKIEGMKPCQ